MSLKQRATKLARDRGLLPMADALRYWMQRYRFRKNNAQFLEEHPDMSIPPDDILYEISGTMDYAEFYERGKTLAEYIYGLIDPLFPSRRSLSVLEWGCGPARVLRWLDGIDPKRELRLSGCDCDERTIVWCTNNFAKINFQVNDMEPPAPFLDSSFDVVYSVSVFTHLSERHQYAWFRDNLRVVRPGGYVIVTVHGDRCCHVLGEDELREYRSGNLVVRSRFATEGKRLFTAYQNPEFMRSKLLRGLEAVQHVQDAATLHDVWVVKKPINPAPGE